MLVATMIFATVMITFASVFQYIAIATGRNRTRLVGQYIAKGVVEKCVAAKFVNVRNLESIDCGGPMTYAPTTMTFRREGKEVVTEYLTQVDVEPLSHPAFTAVQALTVRVRVSWRDKNRDTDATMPYCEYRTYIGQNS